MKKLLSLCLVGVAPLVAPAQAPQASERIPQPIDRNTFAVLTTFYQYDHDIPLELRIVRREETPLYVREKIVFRSIRDVAPQVLALALRGQRAWALALLLALGLEDGWEEDDDVDPAERWRAAVLAYVGGVVASVTFIVSVALIDRLEAVV